jgi:hypothetical protein
MEFFKKMIYVGNCLFVCVIWFYKYNMQRLRMGQRAKLGSTSVVSSSLECSTKKMRVFSMWVDDQYM